MQLDQILDDSVAELLSQTNCEAVHHIPSLKRCCCPECLDFTAERWSVSIASSSVYLACHQWYLFGRLPAAICHLPWFCKRVDAESPTETDILQSTGLAYSVITELQRNLQKASMNKKRLLRIEALGNKFKDEARMKKLNQQSSFEAVAGDSAVGRRGGNQASLRGAKSSARQRNPLLDTTG